MRIKGHRAPRELLKNMSTAHRDYRRAVINLRFQKENGDNDDIIVARHIKDATVNHKRFCQEEWREFAAAFQKHTGKRLGTVIFK